MTTFHKVFIFLCLCAHTVFANGFPVTKQTTPKGQTYWAHKINDLDFVTFIFTFKNTGITSDPLDKLGTTAMLCSVLERGGGAYEEQEMAKLLKNIPCDFAISAGRTDVCISVRILTKDLPLAFSILRKILSEKQMPKEKLALIIKQTIANLEQSLHDPNAIAYHYFQEHFIGDHPFNRQVSTLLKTLPTITSQDLTTALQNIFQKSKLQVTLVGDFDIKKWDILLDDLLENLYPDTNAHVLPKVQCQHLGEHKHREYNVPQTVMMFAAPCIDEKHDDFLAFSLGMEIIGGPESELFKEVREKRGLVYYIGANVNGDPDLSMVRGQAGFLPDKTNEVISLIKTVISGAHSTLSKQQIKEHIESAKHSFAFARTNTFQIAGLMKNSQQLGRSIDWLSSYPDRLSKLKPDDIIKALKTYLHVDRFFFTTVGRTPQSVTDTQS
jgi:zinc protease